MNTKDLLELSGSFGKNALRGKDEKSLATDEHRCTQIKPKADGAKRAAGVSHRGVSVAYEKTELFRPGVADDDSTANINLLRLR
jgi:hypothetical protein